ncbi:MAG: RidA family protein [Acidobacteria bacterium]|nr:RidA family protein [Acidobacteriota bacterium]
MKLRWITISVLLGLGLGCGSDEPAPQADASAFKVERKFIYPKEFPDGKPYNPGVLVGDYLYIAGQVSLDPQTREQPATIADQTHVAMKSMGYVLRDAGMDYDNVVTCHVQLDDMDNYKGMNEVYGSYYTSGRYPARTTLEFPGLPSGSHVEITCIAYADKSKIEVVRPEEGKTPPAMGPYSPAVWAGDRLYLSGQGGRNPTTNELDPTIEGQTKQVLDTIGEILKAAGLGFENTVMVNPYYLGSDNYEKLNSVYQNYFELGRASARASFCLSRLPGDISVEITFVATRNLRKKGRVIPDYMHPRHTSVPGTLDGDTLFLSAKSAADAGDNIESQFRKSMQYQLDSLKLAGMGWEHVVSANVYLKDLGDMPRMTELFREYFPNNQPVRTTVQVVEDGPRAKVLEEIALIAVR